jgi:hypothetical protein
VADDLAWHAAVNYYEVTKRWASWSEDDSSFSERSASDARDGL